MPTSLPPEVREILERVLVCELSTVAKSGTPVTWPLVFGLTPGADEFVLSTAIAYPAKLNHLHRNDKVSLLFSDHTGSGLRGASQVLVQGRAAAPDEIRVVEGLEDFWETLFRKQPDSLHSVLDKETREYTPAAYYHRIRITVQPERVWTFSTDETGQRVAERVA
ncbi:nitroimidazol reductase NimA-like FMN-containing flavoprotein (pyridoxamine 5'-phosphate oxidase superfamily) [Kibdelosporangium banguiense]|uniref:Nitroimidazol reductase NimA-like FMN-containing flavoprotein (Pyridoxamine 5'-phosphate oxidase superfamily) n=1 Tax=Kibdelosporangium banguiense TaxID=1365924 RepID=A0ABS4TYA6_9PSEU|nr:pyridoxamine 5'-phosphate oxidase family protein [Kibdelosporangium banguiense]MBP2329382.1 nitroimidazol reductase NimA-like FMN-containing flavoprotein (pyridoxamine 5'-phosphate oxidase superfamily) [Kibdelosporangium banguiense]